MIDSLPPRKRLDRLVDVVVNKSPPLPAQSLAFVVRRLRYAVPQWRRQVQGALGRARTRLAHERVDGIGWYWPAANVRAGEGKTTSSGFSRPSIPWCGIVADSSCSGVGRIAWRAYTPVARRRFGYYALPMLWRQQVIGWPTWP